MRGSAAVLVALPAFLVFAGGSANAGAAKAIYWPTAQMGAALVAKQYPHVANEPVTAATCSGLGHPRRQVDFAAFSCSVVLQLGNLTITKTVYARPLQRGGVCASTRSLQSCHKLHSERLAWDPTICGLQREYSCAEVAAFTAIEHKYGSHIQGVTCQPTRQDINAWRCHWQSSATPTAATVTFSKGTSAWTTKVSPARS